jgi:uncharacterized protein (TIGR02453 family)
VSGFRGWPAEALDFYDGLIADNSKTYWTAHRSEYDDLVLAPMKALLAELEPEFGVGKVFRPYRDVRFSADKTAYKTHIGALLEGGGYVQLGRDGLAAGLGLYHPEKDELNRYRAAVADERTGPELVRIVDDLQRGGVEITTSDQLKTAPRGFPADHPRIDLLRRKGIAAWKTWPVAPWLGTAKAKDRVVELFRAAQPLATWLEHNVG